MKNCPFAIMVPRWDDMERLNCLKKESQFDVCYKNEKYKECQIYKENKKC